MKERFKYSEWRKKENIKHYIIPDAENYFEDLKNIEFSFSGRNDIPLANTFIMESVQLIVNSISLFELGYFDCAYYSLREAVEISTTIVYLSDMPDEERKAKFEDWKNSKDFPMQGKMLNQLYQHGMVVSDMKEKMDSFFKKIKIINDKINKCIHKQGSNFFYVSRNHPINAEKDDNVFIENYVYFLEKIIGIVAIMRLAIDPFPILLMDEEILFRCYDSVTEAYSIEFVDKYIKSETLEDYKKKNLYKELYAIFMKNEKKNYTIFEIMKNKFIDTTQTKDILLQIHLLDNMDKIASILALSSNKVVKVYAYNGFLMYFTDRQTNRKAHSWSGEDFIRFSKNDEKFNQKYDEAFISVFKYKITETTEEFFYIEHNELLDNNDIDIFKNVTLDKILQILNL